MPPPSPRAQKDLLFLSPKGAKGARGAGGHYCLAPTWNGFDRENGSFPQMLWFLLYSRPWIGQNIPGNRGTTSPVNRKARKSTANRALVENCKWKREHEAQINLLTKYQQLPTAAEPSQGEFKVFLADSSCCPRWCCIFFKCSRKKISLN